MTEQLSQGEKIMYCELMEQYLLRLGLLEKENSTWFSDGKAWVALTNASKVNSSDFDSVDFKPVTGRTILSASTKTLSDRQLAYDELKAFEKRKKEKII